MQVVQDVLINLVDQRGKGANGLFISMEEHTITLMATVILCLGSNKLIASRHGTQDIVIK